MNVIKASPLIFLTLLSLSKTSSNDYYIVSQTPIIGPCDEAGSNINLSLQYKANELNEYREVFQFKTVNETTTYYSSTGKNRSYNNGLVTTNFVLPMQSYFYSSGLKMIINIIKTSTSSIYYSKGHVVYPRSKETINTLLYQKDDYKSKALIIDFTSSLPRYEKYQFSVLSKEVHNNSYSQLVINHLSFNYVFVLPFSYQEAYLTTTDPQGLFTGLIDQTTKSVKIPLKITQNERIMTFSYDFNYYVNKKTLEMSNTYIEGYNKTKTFYLPVNKKELLKDYPFEIHILKAGANHNHIIIPLTYQNQVDLLDNCITSDFCVSGGIKE